MRTPPLAFPARQAAAPTPQAQQPVTPAQRTSTRRLYLASAGVLVLAALVIGSLLLVSPSAPVKQQTSYTQITSFTDSVVSPALSPDGRMLAFIRSDNWFLTPDQIYVKLLPNGEPVQITNDRRPKYGLAFSPDGSRIAYTALTSPNWYTYTVSALGGEPKLLLANAAGLTWLDEKRLLFSEIRTGIHMGVVSALENRSGYRSIYFPRDERGMAHLSYASPDRKWALVVEMDPVWQPCRVVPLDGSSPGWQVGPQGKCTAAAWSPDGKWMYFSVEVQNSRHLWRQRFPSGAPEQITSGATEEEGVAVAPDGGRSSPRSECGRAPSGFMTVTVRAPFLPKARCRQHTRPVCLGPLRNSPEMAVRFSISGVSRRMRRWSYGEPTLFRARARFWSPDSQSWNMTFPTTIERLCFRLSRRVSHRSSGSLRSTGVRLRS